MNNEKNWRNSLMSGHTFEKDFGFRRVSGG
jgi:hypothetical protein